MNIDIGDGVIKKKGTNLGKKFERNFKESALKQDLFILRLNDTDLSFNYANNSRFTPTNPADFLSFYEGNLFLLEMKSTEYSSIGIQRSEDEVKKMIKAHQIRDLSKYSLYDGVFCGFVFNFRSKDSLDETTYYMSIQNFSDFLYKTDKKSISKMDIVNYGGFIIDQTFKRTQYTYNVKKMLEDIKNRAKGNEKVEENIDF